MSSIGILLDTDVRLSAFTHTWKYIQHHERHGDRFVMWVEETRALRILRNKTREQCESTYESLGKISRLAKVGLVTLYDSDETLAEFLNFRPAGFGLGEFHVFSGVEIKHARGPIDRGFRIEASYTPSRAREVWHAFLEQIQHPRFLKLLKHTRGAHKSDLYHVWEAEHNGIDAFVTLDEKFIYAVTKPKSTPLATTVKVCMPSEFLRWIATKIPCRLFGDVFLATCDAATA